MQSYTDFLQENMRDRGQQAAYLKNLRESFHEFDGMDDQQMASYVADVTGYEPLRRFAQNGVQRAADWVGYQSADLFNNITPAQTIPILSNPIRNLAIIGGMEASDPNAASLAGLLPEDSVMNKPVSQTTGQAFEQGAKAFGASESTAKAFGMAGQGVPNAAGQIATAMIPGVGPLAMMGSMYGQGVNSAMDQGVTDWRATASGAIGPAISLATMGLARPLTTAAGNTVLKTVESLAPKSSAALISKTMQDMGAAAFETTVAQVGKASPVSKLAMRAGQELLVETAQAGLGVTGSVAQEVILDPKKFYEETSRTKEFWIPTIVSEVIEGIGGTVIGRKNNPIVVPEDKATVAATNPHSPENVAKMVEFKGEGKTKKTKEYKPKFPDSPSVPSIFPYREGTGPVLSVALPRPITPYSLESMGLTQPEYEAQMELELESATIFPAKTVEAAGGDPLASDAAKTVIETESALQQVASASQVAESVAARTAPDFRTEEDVRNDMAQAADPEQVEAFQAELEEVQNTPEPEPSESLLVEDYPTLLGDTASALVGNGDLDLHSNVASAAESFVVNAVTNKHPNVDEASAIAYAIKNVRDAAVNKNNKDHRIDTDDDGGHISFLNPATAESGIFVHIKRKGPDGKIVNVAKDSSDGEKGSRFIIRPNDLLTLTDARRAEIANRAQITFTEREWGTIKKLAESARQQYLALPVVSFAEGSYDKAYIESTLKFLHQTGIVDALISRGKKLRFGSKAYNVSKRTLLENPLDYFSAMDRASNHELANGGLDYISRNRSFDQESDLHELGHTVGRLIREGGFGEEVQAEWDAFLKAAVEFHKTDITGLSASKGAFAMRQRGEKMGAKAEGFDAEELRNYYGETEAEIEAQTFQGYMLDKTSPWMDYVKANFPSIHQFFTRLFETIRKNKTYQEGYKSINQYSPEFRLGQNILKGIFNSAYAQNAKPDFTLKKLIVDYNLNGIVLDTITRAWYRNSNPGAHKLLKEYVKGWKEELEGNEPTDADVETFVDSVRVLNRGNDFQFNGLQPSKTMWNMPWASKLLRQNLNNIEGLKEVIAAKFKGADIPGLKFNQRLEELFNFRPLTAEELKLNPKSKEYKALTTMIQRRANMQTMLEKVGFAVDEIFAQTGEHRTKPYQVVKQIFQVDAAIKNWMLGRLPGQNGIPMYDIRNDTLGQTNAQTKANKQFSWQFPILAKALKDSTTHSELVPTTYLGANGEIFFGRIKGKNKNLMVFDEKTMGARAREAAEQEAARLNGSAKNSMYMFDVATTTRKQKSDIPHVMRTEESKFYTIRIRERRALKIQKAYVENLTQEEEMGNANDDFRELTNMSEFDRLAEEDANLTFDEYIDEEHEKIRADFAAKHGIPYLRDMHDVIPHEIRWRIENDRIEPFIMQEHATFMKWLDKSVANKEALNKTKQLMGLSKTASPLDVAMTFVQAHFGERIVRAEDAQAGRNTKETARMYSTLINTQPAAIKRFITNYTLWAQQLSTARMNREIQRLAKPDKESTLNGMFPLTRPDQQGIEANLTHTSEMFVPKVASGVTAAINTLPGQKSSRSIKNAGRVIQNIFGRLIQAAQGLHKIFGEGVIHWSLTNPVFRPLGEALHIEMGRAPAHAEEATSPLFITGKMIPDDGKGMPLFVPDENGSFDKSSPLLKIKANKAKEAIFQEILRFQNKAKMRMTDVVATGEPELQQEAREIFERIDKKDWDELYNPAIERLRAGQYARAYRIAEADRANQIAAFAYRLSLDDFFKGSAESAHAYANKFVDLNAASKVASLVNELNMTPEQAGKVAENYIKVEDALRQKHQYLLNHLEYITEIRMKQYHVNVTFKAGTKIGKDEPKTGYYDFDTAEEAYQFIEQAKRDGHKVPTTPRDLDQQKRSKPLTTTYEDIITRTIEARKHLFELSFYGKLDDKDMKFLSNTMDALPGDIDAANDVVEASRTDVRRKLVAGREKLDMIDQYMTSARRVAAASARKRTDLLFRLYGRDKAVQQESEVFKQMDSFREQVRQKDSEAQKMVNKAGYSMFILTNISTGLVEMFQAPITLSSILIEYGASLKDAHVIPAKMFNKATQAALVRVGNKLKMSSKADTDIWSDNKEHVALLKEWQLQGRSNVRTHHELAESTVENMARMYQGKENPTIRPLDMTFSFLNSTYGFFNRINAELSLVSAYEVLRKTKYGKVKELNQEQITELQAQAMLVTDVANGSLQRLGRPTWFKSSGNQGLQVTKSAFWSLQSFVNAQVANQLRLMQKSINVDGKFTAIERKQAQKAFAGMLGVQFVGMGMMGFTLMPAIGKLVEDIFGVDMEEAMRSVLYDDTPDRPGHVKSQEERTFMGELVANGFLSAIGSPIDYGTRISVAGVGPISGFQGLDANQLGGPLVGLATQVYKDMQKVRVGDMDLKEMSVNLLPMGLRRGVRMEFFDNKEIKDSSKRYMFQPNGIEQLGTWAGFTTTKFRKEMKHRTELQEAGQAEIKRTAQLTNSITEAMNAGSAYKMNELINQYANEFKIEPRQVISKVAGKMTDKQMGPNVREGASELTTRANQLFPSPFGNSLHEERLMKTNENILKMGGKPTTTRKTVQRARGLDALLRANPTMTSRTASLLYGENPHGINQMVNQQSMFGLQALLQEGW